MHQFILLTKKSLSTLFVLMFVCSIFLNGGVNTFAANKSTCQQDTATGNQICYYNNEYKVDGPYDSIFAEGGMVIDSGGKFVGLTQCSGNKSIKDIKDPFSTEGKTVQSYSQCNQFLVKDLSVGDTFDTGKTYELVIPKAPKDFKDVPQNGYTAVEHAGKWYIYNDNTGTYVIASDPDVNNLPTAKKAILDNSVSGNNIISNNITPAQKQALEDANKTAKELEKNNPDVKDANGKLTKVGIKCTSVLLNDKNEPIYKCYKGAGNPVDIKGNPLDKKCVASDNNSRCIEAAELGKITTLAVNKAVSNIGGADLSKADVTVGDVGKDAGNELFKFVMNFIGYALIVLEYYLGWILSLLLWVVFIVISHLLSINPFSNPWYPVLLKLWGFFFGVSVLAILGSMMYSGFKRFLNFTGSSTEKLETILTPIVILLIAINFTFFGIISAYGIAQGIGKVVMYSAATQLECSKTDFSQGDQQAYLAIFKCVGNNVGSISAIRPTLDLGSTDSNLDNLSTIGDCLDTGNSCSSDAIKNNIGDKTGRTIAVLFAETMFILVIATILWNFIVFMFTAASRIVRLAGLTAVSPLILTGFTLTSFKPLNEFGRKSAAELGSHLVFFPYVSVWIACIGILASTLKTTFGGTGVVAYDGSIAGGLSVYAQAGGIGSVAEIIAKVGISSVILIATCMFFNKSVSQAGLSAGMGAVGGLFNGAAKLSGAAALMPVKFAGKGVGAAAGKAGAAIGSKMAGSKGIGAIVSGIKNNASRAGLGGGALSGAVVGGMVAGPVGAVAGAALGSMSGLGAGVGLKNKVTSLHSRLTSKYGAKNTSGKNTNTSQNKNSTTGEGEENGTSENTVPAPTQQQVNRQLALARSNAKRTGEQAANSASDQVREIQNGDLALGFSALTTLLGTMVTPAIQTAQDMQTLNRNLSTGAYSMNLAKESLQSIAQTMGQTRTSANKMADEAPAVMKAILKASKDGSITITATQAKNLSGAAVSKGIMGKGEQSGYLGAVMQQAKSAMADPVGSAKKALGVENPAPTKGGKMQPTTEAPKTQTKQPAQTANPVQTNAKIVRDSDKPITKEDMTDLRKATVDSLERAYSAPSALRPEPTQPIERQAPVNLANVTNSIAQNVQQNTAQTFNVQNTDASTLNSSVQVTGGPEGTSADQATKIGEAITNSQRPQKSASDNPVEARVGAYAQAVSQPQIAPTINIPQNTYQNVGQPAVQPRSSQPYSAPMSPSPIQTPQMPAAPSPSPVENLTQPQSSSAPKPMPVNDIKPFARAKSPTSTPSKPMSSLRK
jgi:hypothetical protein